ncbi:rhodanese-like domain-containing protein [Gordonia sp. CPCC 205515]|uniref:rhodanese-like domain-containing protein n=1 Tax=Gordonia sp. CPCC 205515 TaxID=3140791 RepID=UPI003AF3E82D
MTAVLASRDLVAAPISDARLSAQSADFHALVAAGVTPIDVRSQRKRDLDGVLSGAMAIDAAEVLARLTPGDAESLSRATLDARWLLISDDGHEAEWLAWHLQARGITGATFLVGGFRALRRDRVTGRISDQELAAISAH